MPMAPSRKSDAARTVCGVSYSRTTPPGLSGVPRSVSTDRPSPACPGAATVRGLPLRTDRILACGKLDAGAWGKASTTVSAWKVGGVVGGPPPRPARASTIGSSWNGPVASGSGGSWPSKRPAPETSASLQASFFMPSFGWTQGPPVSLHPGDAAVPNSSPRLSARPTA